jgi:hypothetical protein
VLTGLQDYERDITFTVDYNATLVGAHLEFHKKVQGPNLYLITKTYWGVQLYGVSSAWY